jgi:hypothetical protein
MAAETEFHKLMKTSPIFSGYVKPALATMAQEVGGYGVASDGEPS